MVHPPSPTPLPPSSVSRSAPSCAMDIQHPTTFRCLWTVGKRIQCPVLSRLAKRTRSSPTRLLCARIVLNEGLSLSSLAILLHTPPSPSSLLSSAFPPTHHIPSAWPFFTLLPLFHNLSPPLPRLLPPPLSPPPASPVPSPTVSPFSATATRV
ncbi:unnamed protein product [Closterium sp. NIES-53]